MGIVMRKIPKIWNFRAQNLIKDHIKQMEKIDFFYYIGNELLKCVVIGDCADR